MAIKDLQKSVEMTSNIEKKTQEFISKGGSLSLANESREDHRLTLRIPRDLMHKVDAKRKERIGIISRNLWILETIEKAVK